jgi:hypothetical protein
MPLKLTAGSGEGAGAGAELTCTVKPELALPEALSATWTVNVELPAAVGVPPNTPAEVSVNPAGSEPDISDQL